MTTPLAQQPAAGARGSRQPEVREKWLTVQQASALIGVAPATLRRWSAAGEVPAFTTPGGHRRFARSMILGLLPTTRATTPVLERTGETRGQLTEVLGGHLVDACRDARWPANLDPEQRRALRDYGRSITESLVATLDARTPGDRSIYVADAVAAAGEAGRVAALAGARISEIVETFVRIRRRWLAELVAPGRRHGLATGDVLTLLGTANQFGDRLHVALVAGHQAETAPRTSRRGTP
jgi:excisionase family DNA binding protein